MPYTQAELDRMAEFEDDEEDDYEDDDTPEEDEVPPEGHDHELSFDEIVDQDDTAEEKFYVKEWKGYVVLKGLTKGEFDYMRKASRSREARGRSNSVLEREVVLSGLVRPRLDQAKYNVLLEKNAGSIIRIMTRILEKSGLAEEAEKARERRFPRR